MNGAGGYVKLHRSLLDHPLVTQLPAAWLRVYVVLLMKVNWKPGVWWNGTQNIEIPAGSMVSSVEKLSRMSGASTKQTRGALGYFQTANIAAIQTASRYSIITIFNWDTYQNSDEHEGKPNGELEGKQRAKSGQSEGKLEGNNQRSQEGKKGIREKNVKNEFDTRSALREDGAKTDQADVVAFDAEEAKQLSGAIGKHFGVKIDTPSPLWPTGCQEPPASIVDQVSKALGHDLVSPFCDYLRKLPAQYQCGGRGAPRSFGWYVSTARDFANKQSPQKPTDEQCGHGYAYGDCSICLPPETFARMSECF